MPTQAPIVAESRPGMLSLSTRTPPGRTVRRTRASPSCPAAVELSGEPDALSGSSSGTSGVDTRCGRVGSGRGAVGTIGDHGVQRDLAARVDLGNLDLDLLADRDDVLDVLHPLATDEPADLRDVQQTVAARAERDERAEGRRLHDGADEALTDLRHVRVGDRVDHLTRGLGRGAVGRTDVHGAVVLDRDVGAGVGLDLVDHLALRADDLADPVSYT